MLTPSQKFEIIRLLGYPLGTLDEGSLDYSNIIVGKLNRIDGDAQVEIEKVVSWINETEDQIDSAIGTQRVKRIDEIEFFQNPTEELRRDRSKYLRMLSSMLGIPIRGSSSAMGTVCI